MNMRIKIILILFLLMSSNIFAWGDKGHSIITKKAISLLSDDFSFLKEKVQLIMKMSLEPDKRKSTTPGEYEKHYMDIDYYKEFLNGEMIHDKNELIGIYGDSIVAAMGILPWAVLSAYEDLKFAFKNNDSEKIILYIADLCHYVADAYQPLHTSQNYDGELTGQKGIHYRYEIKMVEGNIAPLEETRVYFIPQNIQEPLSYIFDCITMSNVYLEAILTSDRAAFKRSGKECNDKYYQILWSRIKYLTKELFVKSSNSIAALICLAWREAKYEELR